ncbi:MAG: NTP transferase domain-containing protein [Deltaproteobacteria bacterium]|nr:NTP transferase domain-containing protein [Deltaproteobacteria bacterium]
MKAMVLAAGQGTRLRPLTDTRPKALVPVAGRPMIEYSLLLLRHHGIVDVVINLHHWGEQIEERLGDGKQLGLKISYSIEPELLDTGGGLLKAKSFFRDETFIVVNTDVMIDLQLDQLLKFHKEKQAAATLVLRPDEHADQYGSMDTDVEGRICRFLDKRIPEKHPGPTRKLMFTGVQVLEPKVFDYMESGSTPHKFSTTRQTYPRMLADQQPLYGFCFEGFWQDLGTVERIRQAEDSLARGRVGLHYLQNPDPLHNR